MGIVIRAEEIMELVGIDVLIHRYSKDVFLRGLIMGGEVEGIIIL